MSVVFPVPDAYQALVHARRWLSDGVPLLKNIVALAGDQVCVFDEHFEVVDLFLVRRAAGEDHLRGVFAKEREGWRSIGDWNHADIGSDPIAEGSLSDRGGNAAVGDIEG